MNRVLLSVALFGWVAVIFGEECDMKKVDGFMECVGGKMKDDKARWTPDLIKEKHEAIANCFSSNGCEKPDLERDIFSDLPPNFQVLARKMKADWESTPADVKKCFFEDMKDEIKDKLNECLTHQKVPVIKELPEGILKKAAMMMGSGDKEEDKKMIEAIFTAKINVARGFRLCYETKGEEAMKKGLECFQNVRTKYMFDKMCTDKKACIKDKLDDTCTKRGEEIENACCKCNEEKRDATLKKMDDLKKTSSPDMDSVAEMMCEGHNITEMMDRAEDCFKKSSLQVPAGLKLLSVMHGAKNTPNAPKFQFNNATINTIQDVMMAMMDHEECYVCHTGANATKPSD